MNKKPNKKSNKNPNRISHLFHDESAMSNSMNMQSTIVAIFQPKFSEPFLSASPSKFIKLKKYVEDNLPRDIV